MAVLVDFINASLTHADQAAALRAATGYRVLAHGKDKGPEASSGQ
jgi:hypothetical protein